jgi:solute:Na+ symporter, SSS family
VATLFSYDLYRRWYPTASERSTILVGRIVTFCGMLAAIAWSPACSHYESIFQGVQTLVCMIAPPITAVFVWGVFSKKVTASGAIVTLWIGAALGLTVFLLDWHKETTGWNVPILMATFYLFAICSVVLLVVSHALRRPLTPEQEELVWASPMQALRGSAWPGIGNYRLLAGILFIAMVGLYVVFA